MVGKAAENGGILPIWQVWAGKTRQEPVPGGIAFRSETAVRCPVTRVFRLAAVPMLALALAACVPAKLPGLTALLPGTALPAMRWDHRPEAAEWTSRSLAAIARHDAALAAQVPGDIRAWCPAYETNGIAERRAFWVGLMSAVAKYESSWNPKASGGGGRYIGLMQISPKSARNYGCTATSAGALKDGAANLECAAELVAYHVARDGQVAGKGNRGIGRDWMPLRKSSKRAEIAAWTSAQSYCQ